MPDVVLDDRAYSPAEAARLSSLSLRFVMKAVATGELRSSKKGRRRLIFHRDLIAYLRSEEQGG